MSAWLDSLSWQEIALFYFAFTGWVGSIIANRRLDKKEEAENHQRLGLGPRR